MTILVGIGNPYRGDDAVGLQVAKSMAEAGIQGLTVIEYTDDILLIMEQWNKNDRVILCDAMLANVEPGEIARFNLTNECAPSDLFRYSTHSVSLAEVIEIARSLNKLPKELILYCISGKNFMTGTKISEEVEKAVPTVIERVLLEI